MNTFDCNRYSWNKLSPLHFQSKFYDVDAFKEGKSSLNPIEISEIGAVKGKKLLHLQCHFGLDTLSFARMGASVTGIDLSDESICLAQKLAEELKLDAQFVQSNVLELDQNLEGQYDIVFASYGTINWLDDLDQWAKIIKHFLKPGGIFYMVEFHPYIYTLGKKLRIENEYFKTDAIESKIQRSYTDNSEIEEEELRHFEWHHSLSEVMNSLIGNGLQIEFLNEIPYQPYNCFENMEELLPGKWVFKKVRDKIPYLFSVKALKKG
jgi:SAM-dependent methyltransferase